MKCIAEAYIPDGDGKRHIGKRVFRSYYDDPKRGYIQYNRQVWRAYYDPHKPRIIALELHKRLFGFRFTDHAHKKKDGRIDGQLYWFASNKQRQAWLQGYDLPDGKDSFECPVPYALGEFRKIRQEHCLPVGWHADDAIFWSTDIFT